MRPPWIPLAPEIWSTGRFPGWLKRASGGQQHPRVLVLSQGCLLCSRYLEQILELTFSEEEQLKKFNHLKTYNLQKEMKSLR